MENYDYQLTAIEKRRWQLWALALAIIILFAMTIAALSYWSSTFPGYMTQLLNMGVIRVSLVIISVAFCVYIVEKELIFWRISRNLINEKVKIETLNHEVNQVEALLNASKAVNSSLGVRSVLDIILKSALELLKADHGSIMLYNELNGYLEMASYAGLDENIAIKAKVIPGEGIAGKVFNKGKAIVIEGKPNEDKFVKVPLKSPPILSSMCVPLTTQEKILGVINISITSNEAIPYIKQDLKTLSIFAGQAASAIENARLFEKTRMSKSHLLKLNEELKDKNKSLKTYVTELKKVNSELEKFNRLTINRELAMVKLKEKVKKLESSK